MKTGIKLFMISILQNKKELQISEEVKIQLYNTVNMFFITFTTVV